MCSCIMEVGFQGEEEEEEEGVCGEQPLERYNWETPTYSGCC